MPGPILIFSQSDYLIGIVAIKSHTLWQTVQIQISWLLQKPTDQDLHCLQKQSISGVNRTRVKFLSRMANSIDPDQEQSDLGLHCLHMPFYQGLWCMDF